MNFDPTPYLLLILLIITGVALFLCVLNFISLRDLTRRIHKARKTQVLKEKDIHGLAHPEAKRGQERRSDPWSGGIISGIGLIADIYHLDSLTIASKDGLVVASYGSSDPEFEAAYFADLLSRNVTIADTGVSFFEFACGGMDLICIARARDLLSIESKQWIKADVQTVFNAQFGQNPGISGETI
jgi:hypothetical protein